MVEARTKLNNNNNGVSLVKSSKIDSSPVTIFNSETVTITKVITNAYCFTYSVGGAVGLPGVQSPVCPSLRKRRSTDDDETTILLEGHSISPSQVERYILSSNSYFIF